MPYSEELDSRIGRELETLGVTRKKMFGGVCYLWKGNMLCGVYRDCLIARLGEAETAKALTTPHTRPFDITGKAMKGWVMVESPGYAGRNLGRWLALSKAFVAGLPEKLAGTTPQP